MNPPTSAASFPAPSTPESHGNTRVLFRVEHAAVFRRVGSHVFTIKLQNIPSVPQRRSAPARIRPTRPHGAVGWLRDLLHQPLGSLCRSSSVTVLCPAAVRVSTAAVVSAVSVCGLSAAQPQTDSAMISASKKGDPFLIHNLCSYSLGSPVSPTAI